MVGKSSFYAKTNKQRDLISVIFLVIDEKIATAGLQAITFSYLVGGIMGWRYYFMYSQFISDSTVSFAVH